MSAEHEFELIDRIRRRAASHPQVSLGIGDDAAVLMLANSADKLLVTKDVLMEGVHFNLATTQPTAVGRKALAVNLSDIAAMAGKPTAAFVGLVLPRSRGAVFAEELMQGIFNLADEFDVAIAGGDTNIWESPAVISITLLGETTSGGPVLRSGAQIGDWLMVTGALGGSLTGRHLSFTPRIHEAAMLHASVPLHAMLDLSDGLSSDIQHLTTESTVGTLLQSTAIPIHADVDFNLSSEDRLQRALSDGEDFELLFAVTPDVGEQLLRQPPFETTLTRVGECIAEAGCWLEVATGERVPLVSRGWQHRFGD